MARIVEGEGNKGSTKSTVGPIKWFAVECILSKQYSEKSDVWAWGISVIEMLTSSKWQQKKKKKQKNFGNNEFLKHIDEPYGDMEPMAVGIAVVSTGLRPQIPDYTPRDFAELIFSCWNTDPHARVRRMKVFEIVCNFYSLFFKK